MKQVDSVNISKKYVDETQNNRHNLTDDEIISYASKAGLLNYVDNETPRRYWIDDRNEVEDFVAFVQDMIKKASEK